MTDTKRGADTRAVSIAGHAFTVGEVREMLREQGLHVVTAAQKAVLDACAKAEIVQAYEDPCFTMESDEAIAAAERALREAAK